MKLLLKGIVFALLSALYALPVVAQTPEVTGAAGTIGPDGVYLPGNGVTVPRLSERVGPETPDLARKLHASGDVVLSVVVTSNGTVRDIQVLKPVGYGMDEEAVRSVRKWRFRPGAKDGVPVDVRVKVEVAFRLQLDDKTWRAGPLVFDVETGITPPVLKSGLMPKAVREAGNETVVFAFTINRAGEVQDIRPLDGEDSPSVPALTSSLSTWKFEPASNGTERVMTTARVLLIKGEDQFRYEVSSSFHN